MFVYFLKRPLFAISSLVIISGEGLLDADGLLSNEAAALARKNNAILIAL